MRAAKTNEVGFGKLVARGIGLERLSLWADAAYRVLRFRRPDLTSQANACILRER
jgi:hypothetical protein